MDIDKLAKHVFGTKKREKDLYEDMCETQDRIDAQDKIEEFKEENSHRWAAMSDKEKLAITIEQDLADLSNILRRLEQKGTNPEIIADNIYNAVSTRTITLIDSRLDSNLRSLGYTG